MYTTAIGSVLFLCCFHIFVIFTTEINPTLSVFVGNNLFVHRDIFTIVTTMILEPRQIRYKNRIRCEYG